MIAVTGATGQVGGRVARSLAARGLPLRLVVRDASRAPALEGAELAVAEYRDGGAMRRALDGADAVLLVSGSESRDRLTEHFSAVDACAAAGVRHVVYTSWLGATPDHVFTFARDHAATEDRIRAAGLAFTFLRDSMYAEYAPLMALPEGVIRGPAGSGPVAWVGRDDVAAAAVAVLADPAAHAGRSYDLTGPEALTMAETADVISSFARRPVTYVEETLEEARESRRPSGHPDWEIEGWVTSYAAIAQRTLERVTDCVERLTGRAPRSLADVLREHPETYRHLLG